MPKECFFVEVNLVSNEFILKPNGDKLMLTFNFKEYLLKEFLLLEFIKEAIK